MNSLLGHVRAGFIVWFTMIWVSGCATTGTVTKTRDLNEEVERRQVPDDQLTVRLLPYGDVVEAKLVQRTEYYTFNKVQVRSGTKYQDGTQPALVWGGVGVATALTGLIVRYGETQQSVERVRYVSGDGAQTPETSYRTVPAKSRVASSTFFVSSGVFFAVGMGQLAAPLLPPFNVHKSIDEQYVRNRVEVMDVPQSTVSLFLGKEEVASAATNSEGIAKLPLQGILSVSDWSARPAWSWTGTVRAQGPSANVDLRNSEEVGMAAGQWVQGQVKRGAHSQAKDALLGVAPHHKAYSPAWGGFCTAAKPLVPTLDSPSDAKGLLPEPVGEVCVSVIAGIEKRADIEIRAALKNKDVPGAESWLELASAEKQGVLSGLIDITKGQIQAACDRARNSARKAMRPLVTMEYADIAMDGLHRLKGPLVTKMQDMVYQGGPTREGQRFADCATNALAASDDLVRGIYQMNRGGYAHEWLAKDRFGYGQEGILSSIAEPGDSCRAYVRKRFGNAMLRPIEAYLSAIEFMDENCSRSSTKSPSKNRSRRTTPSTVY